MPVAIASVSVSAATTALLSARRGPRFSCARSTALESAVANRSSTTMPLFTSAMNARSASSASACVPVNERNLRRCLPFTL